MDDARAIGCRAVASLGGGRPPQGLHRRDAAFEQGLALAGVDGALRAPEAPTSRRCRQQPVGQQDRLLRDPPRSTTTSSSAATAEAIAHHRGADPQRRPDHGIPGYVIDPVTEGDRPGRHRAARSRRPVPGPCDLVSATAQRQRACARAWGRNWAPLVPGLLHDPLAASTGTLRIVDAARTTCGRATPRRRPTGSTFFTQTTVKPTPSRSRSRRRPAADRARASRRHGDRRRHGDVGGHPAGLARWRCASARRSR